MKVLLTSDTHYGYDQKTHRYHEKFLTEIAELVDKGEVDIVVHAGDWSTNRQDQFHRTLKMFRRYLSVPILTVKGNHEFWDQKKDGRKMQKKHMYHSLIKMHDEWFEESDIHYLGNGEFVKDDVCFVGFDGWYGYVGEAKRETRDGEVMVRDVEGCETMVYLSNKAYKDLDELLAKDYSKYRKVVCVSHFPPLTEDWKGKDKAFSANMNFLEPMKEKFDVLCFGHSHMRVERKEDGTWIYNCGSHYDKPRYLIFEV